MINEDQTRILIQYMARHGDLRRSGLNNRETAKRKWLQLVEILNQLGEKKTLQQWSKVWSDTKYNAIKKYKNVIRGLVPGLSENDKIIIKLLREQGCVQYFSHKTPGSSNISMQESTSNNSTNLNNVLCNTTIEIKEEVTKDNDTSHPGPVEPEPATEKVFYVSPITEQQSHSLQSSSNSSHETPAVEPFSFQESSMNQDRRKSTDSVDKMSEMADKFYELEKERERMAHEREMARIQQHNELLTVMTRLVNVVETLAPSLKRYLDKNVNGGA